MSGSRLGPITSPEVAASGFTTLLVPLGATEQHGPHLPIDTDTRIAVAWADGVAARVAGSVAAPPLAYGSSGEHQDFPGTLSIGQDALATVLLELVRSAGRSFPTVVFLSGHAGNAEPVAAAAARLRAEGHRVLAFFPSWDRETMGFGIDAHAGRVETSLLLHLAPESVDLGRARAGNRAPIESLLDGLRTTGVAAVSPTGVLGDPSGASSEEGSRLLEDLVVRTAASILENTGRP